MVAAADETITNPEQMGRPTAFGLQSWPRVGRGAPGLAPSARPGDFAHPCCRTQHMTLSCCHVRCTMPVPWQSPQTVVRSWRKRMNPRSQRAQSRGPDAWMTTPLMQCSHGIRRCSTRRDPMPDAPQLVHGELSMRCSTTIPVALQVLQELSGMCQPSSRAARDSPIIVVRSRVAGCFAAVRSMGRS